jgi:hypothetical protein
VIDWETQKFLIEIEYLNLGLVPLSHYPRSVNGSLEACFLSMEPEKARASKRKFRKILRKARKSGITKMSYDSRQSAVKWHIMNNYVLIDAVDNDE